MGVDKKTTLMAIKVDLQCCRCYKKIKKVLCGIPQIQDQVYNEKENFVIIKVVCCSPEKIKQKIICKGGCAVKSIEIKEVDKPKEPEKPKEPPKEPEKPKEQPVELKEGPKKGPIKNGTKDVSSDDNDVTVSVGGAKPTGPLKAKEPEKPKEKPPAQCPPPCPQQLAYPVPFGTCCTECYGGRGGGPCYSGHGRPPPCYDGYYGRPIYDSYGGGRYRSSYGSRCDFLSEENPSGCSIM